MNRSVDFGFGCMRLPVLKQDDPASFDYEKIEKLFDAFLEQGFTYFDTAYTYHGYHGEEAVRHALVERHPRESFQLATKLPLRDFKDQEDMEHIFNEQLEHCGVEYFDYYLLHNMGTNVYEKCKKYDAFGFVSRKKAQGQIKNIGMSFHDMPELLEEILTEYGSMLDFIQLQVNYADWEQPNVQSRRCLEIAPKFHLPVVVMEPCKGGTLINLPEEGLDLLKDYHPQASAASWTLRFAASQTGVVRVLSGMNTMEQVMDNTAVFKNFVPISQEENEIIRKVTAIIEKNTPIPCTGCAYCTHGCPMDIAIPQYFALYNNISRITGSFSSHAVYYNNLSLRHGKASACIGCRQCEQACPQHLPITDFLKQVAEKFEGGSSFPVRK
ncbi:MAG TPA: aldo/keto reductase [Candidatus Scybalocola faecigallinarum]|uniref:Aldo/keto reductase n=1 Tax=Candidatus Scybalocola faecigallinarum TaxID=2840941 RepID=A0A9D1JRQ2_9FIRM|nr:aldo/keto reductase [Candidatus Scybalocola faecigallinarum]